MLLSMLLAFLFARRFHGALCVFLLIVSLGLIAFLSTGFPVYQANDRHFSTGESVVLVRWALPLSYPLFASVRFGRYDTYYGVALVYHVYLLGFLLKDDWVFVPGFSGRMLLNFTVFDYVLYYSFFMLINIVGVIVGYAMGRVRLRDKLRQTMVFVKGKDHAIRRKLVKDGTIAAVAGALLICSVLSLADAVRIWSGYMWALESFSQSRILVPRHLNPVVDTVSLAFKDYVVLFPLQVFLTLSTAIGGVILLSMKLRRKTFVASAALLISSGLMLFEASKILEVYRWANLRTNTPPLSYYSDFLVEASETYQVLFPLYVQIGLISLVFGVFLAVMTVKERFEPEKGTTPYTGALGSPASSGTLL